MASAVSATTERPSARRSFKVVFFEKLGDGQVRFDFIQFQQVFLIQVVVLLLLFSPWIAGQLSPAHDAGQPWWATMARAAVSWLLLAAWLGVSYVAAAFFEWVFHRYLFHIVPNFMARKHTLHHFLHPVNNYHSHQEEQTESAHFPIWALPTFMAVFTLVSWPLHRLLPHQPILLAVNMAVALGYYRYELTHAQKHYSIQWQLEKLNDPRRGLQYEQRFVLHFIHHDKPRFNMAVFAEDIKSLPDRLLGTLLPGRLLRDDAGQVVVRYEDEIPYFTIILPEALPKPIWPVRLVDRLSIRWQAAFFRLFPRKRAQYHF